MKLIGYGEDALTLWTITEQLDKILSECIHDDGLVGVVAKGVHNRTDAPSCTHTKPLLR